MSNIVTVPADKLAELQREAARYRWLTQHAHVGECFTDAGTVLEIFGCDRQVPNGYLGKPVGEAIDAAMGMSPLSVEGRERAEPVRMRFGKRDDAADQAQRADGVTEMQPQQGENRG